MKERENEEEGDDEKVARLILKREPKGYYDLNVCFQPGVKAGKQSLNIYLLFYLTVKSFSNFKPALPIRAVFFLLRFSLHLFDIYKF